VSADGRTEMEQEFFLIFLMIFLKKYVILLFQNESMQWECFLPKKKTKLNFKTTFETAIRNQNLNISDGEMFLSMFQSWTNPPKNQ
jgi:hypothetical protein